MRDLEYGEKEHKQLNPFNDPNATLTQRMAFEKTKATHWSAARSLHSKSRNWCRPQKAIGVLRFSLVITLVRGFLMSPICRGKEN